MIQARSFNVIYTIQWLLFSDMKRSLKKIGSKISKRALKRDKKEEMDAEDSARRGIITSSLEENEVITVVVQDEYEGV